MSETARSVLAAIPSVLRQLGEQVIYMTKGLVIALLPYPESDVLARRWEVYAAPFSALIGVFEATFALGFFFYGAIQTVETGSLFMSHLLLENWFEGLGTQHFQGGGMIALMMWFVHPLSWFLMMQAVTGAARIAAFVASQQPLGEPLVWLVVRFGQLVKRLAVTAKRARDFGPLRSDRISWGAGGCDLEIVTCRQRATWTEGATLEVHGRFFQPLGPGQRTPDGPHWALTFRFSEIDPNSVIRGLVQYRDIVDELAPEQPHRTEDLP